MGQDDSLQTGRFPGSRAAGEPPAERKDNASVPHSLVSACRSSWPNSGDATWIEEAWGQGQLRLWVWRGKDLAPG